MFFQFVYSFVGVSIFLFVACYLLLFGSLWVVSLSCSFSFFRIACLLAYLLSHCTNTFLHYKHTAKRSQQNTEYTEHRFNEQHTSNNNHYRVAQQPYTLLLRCNLLECLWLLMLPISSEKNVVSNGALCVSFCFVFFSNLLFIFIKNHKNIYEISIK